MKHIIFCCLIACSVNSQAQWASVPDIDNALTEAPAAQQRPGMVSDGDGGVIMAWTDSRNITGSFPQNTDIYVQWIDKFGNLRWQADGVQISRTDPAVRDFDPHIVADGAGGAYVAWVGYSPSSMLYAIQFQRIYQDGTTMYFLPISPATSTPSLLGNPRVAHVGTGNAVVVWSQSSNTPYVKAQRFVGTDKQWGDDGRVLHSGKFLLGLDIRNTVNGMYVTMQPEGGLPLFIQRVNDQGWGEWGDSIPTLGRQGITLPMFSAQWIGFPHRFFDVTHGVGQAEIVITWMGRRNQAQSTGPIWIQAIDASGAFLWPDTLAVCSINDANQFPRIVVGHSLDTTDYRVVWSDYRTGASSRAIFAQRISQSGQRRWGANGVPVRQDIFNVNVPVAVTSFWDGSIVVVHQEWITSPTTRTGLVGYRIDKNGANMWDPNGVSISQRGLREFGEVRLIGSGILPPFSARVGFSSDEFNPVTTGFNVYAKRIQSDGTLGGVGSNYFFPLQSYTPDDIHDFDFSGFLGYAVGNGHIGVSTDGGNSWDSLITIPGSILNSITFRNPSEAFAVGNAGTIYKILNGTPALIPSGTLEDLTSIIYTPGLDQLTVVGSNGTVGKSTNGGNSWSFNAPLTGSIRTISSDPTLPGIPQFLAAGNSGGLFRSTDLGTTWQQVVTNTTLNLNWVQLLSPTTAIAAGDSGVILSINGDIVTNTNSPFRVNLHAGMIDGSRLTIVGSDNALLQSLDGGTSFQQTTIPQSPPRTLRAIRKSVSGLDGIDSVVTTIVGDDGRIYRSTQVITSVESEEHAKPEIHSLEQNYPNPFNPSTIIRYQLAATSEVRLSIYDLLGRKVADLVNEQQPAGTHHVEWNATAFASGVYIYKLEVKGFAQTKKLLLLR